MAIMAGYNDVPWHNPDIIAPHMDNLAKSGIIMENHYAQQICTPTRYLSCRMWEISYRMCGEPSSNNRSALMTGYYPIHLGRQV